MKDEAPRFFIGRGRKFKAAQNEINYLIRSLKKLHMGNVDQGFADINFVRMSTSRPNLLIPQYDGI